jgi:hypothetical protein
MTDRARARVIVTTAFACISLAALMVVTAGCGSSGTEMDEAEFWRVIEMTRKADPDAHCEALSAELSSRSIEAIHLFGFRWDQALGDAYTWDLWGAAYLIGGGASDDGFEYFRDWLVLQGREIYEAALASPDSLAAVAKPREDEIGYQYECYPAQHAWAAATGRTDPEAFYESENETLARLGISSPSGPPSRFEPAGENWDFDDAAEAHRRLPRLAARYLDE